MADEPTLALRLERASASFSVESIAMHGDTRIITYPTAFLVLGPRVGTVHVLFMIPLTLHSGFMRSVRLEGGATLRIYTSHIRFGT